MKSLLVVILLFGLINFAFGQANTVRIMTTAEVNTTFSAEVKKKFGITYNIYRVYKYSDKGGNYLLAMTENIAKIAAQNDTITDKIKGLFFKENGSTIEKQVEINDFTIKQEVDDVQEKIINFWGRYCSFQDLDNDGMIEPIVVYGTKGSNDYGDGRIKILVFYKGKKTVIRHQNGVLDHERNTQIDVAFYDLPQTVQKQVKTIIGNIKTNNHGIFPNNLETEMKKRSTKIAE